MAQITPKTVIFAADSRFLPGGSVIFGQPGIVPDAENPATLKSVYLDEAETQIAQNPQPLDSSAKFQQSPDGILYGTGEYSWIWFDASGVEVYRDLNISLQEDFGTAAFVDTGTASDEVPLNSSLTDVVRDSDITDVLRDSDIGQSVAGLSSPGEENLDSGNTNLNKFSGDSSTQTIAVGFGSSTTEVIFPLPISSNTPPSSSTNNGTFNILNAAFVTVASGVTGMVTNQSSSKIALYSVSGLSGINVNGAYMLSTASSTSSITINF